MTHRRETSLLQTLSNKWVINRVVDANDEDSDIFELDRSLSGVFKTFLKRFGVFKTFLNQWFVKNDKSVFKLVFRFHSFPQNLEILETHAQKEFHFQHYHETKISQII